MIKFDSCGIIICEVFMKTQSGTNVWYLLTLIVLALVFIFVGVKYLNKGENNQQISAPAENTQNVTNPKSNSDSGSKTKQNLPIDQQYAANGADSLNKNDYQMAIDYFSQAIAANPEAISYYSLKSQAEVLAGKDAEAKATLEAGLKVDPNNELLNSKLDVLNNSQNLVPADQETPRQ